MAGSVNKVILVGNLGDKPEVRVTQDGSKMANFSLATSESWKDKLTGDRKEKTEWHRVVIFNPNLSEVAENFLKKGTKVYIEGQLQTRKWQDQEGKDRFTTEVVLGRFRGELVILTPKNEAGYDVAPSMAEAVNSNSSPDSGASSSMPINDEIPF